MQEPAEDAAIISDCLDVVSAARQVEIALEKLAPLWSSSCPRPCPMVLYGCNNSPATGRELAATGARKQWP